MVCCPDSHELWGTALGLIAPGIWMHRWLLLAYRRSFGADFPKNVQFGTAFTTEQSLTQVGMLPQLLQTVLQGVREINTYGLSRKSCTPKHLLASLFIFLLNLHYLYMESLGTFLLSKISTLWSKSQRTVWAVFLGCLQRPHDRAVLPGIRQSPKGENKLLGSIRIEENIGHKPLVMPDVVNSTCSAATQKCSCIVQGTAPCGCASLYKHHLEAQLPKKRFGITWLQASPSGGICVQTQWPAYGVPAEAFSCTRTPAEALAPMLTSPYAAVWCSQKFKIISLFSERETLKHQLLNYWTTLLFPGSLRGQWHFLAEH